MLLGAVTFEHQDMC